jgi:oxygen-independent coproporphyrinogen-3 oxidase
VPFCDTLCWFCGCHTTVINNYAPMRGYLDLLLREIDMVARLLPGGQRVTHMHWGGGSPTLLRPLDVAKLNGALRTRFSFANSAEFAVEIDPRGFGSEAADALAAAGLTRASIGLQDCDPVVQRAINRIQSDEETAHAVSLLRARGVKSLNIDVIYGLPHQTVSGIERTIDFALSLDPDRLAVFGYAHVPHFKKHQALIPEVTLPGIAERYAQAEAVQARLKAAGYVAVGLDHFAKPHDTMAVAQRDGALARNFQGYTTDAAPALIGFGTSAIGSLPQGYVQNVSDTPSYRSAILAGKLPIARGVELSADDRLHRQVIERLMCDLSVDLDAIAASFGRTRAAFAGAIASLKKLEDDRLVVIDDGRVSVPESARPAVRLVCAAFDAYLTPEGRHAVAV